MKTEHQLRVEEFMRLAGQQVPTRPLLASPEVRRLRAGLILEEALETIEALGFEVLMKPTDGEADSGPDALNHGELVVSEKQVREPDLVEIVDGCADISVVTTGTLCALGVSDKMILAEVDANNLQKFGPGSYRRESDGKWIKPPGHKAPDIMGCLILQGYGDKYFGQPEHAAPGFQPK